MEYPQTPQDLKIVHFEVGDFKDPNNNTWCNVLFEGYTSEPIRWVVKDPSAVSVGQTVYGHFETKMSKANKPYLRFYRDQRQQFGQPSAQAGQVAQAKYAPKDDHTQESIARSVALKAAVDFMGTTEIAGMPKGIPNVLSMADAFLAWLQGGSNGSVAVPIPSAQVTTQATGNPQSAATGYDKFKQFGNKLQDKREDEAIHEQLEEQQGYEDLPPGF